MNSKLRKLLMHGFLRRKKEIIRACITTFLAIFFISGILLFQENMYQWQMVENRKTFGDWFVIENYQQTKGLIDNEYLTDAATAGTYAMMYDQNWLKTRVNVGYMTQEFMDNGNIRLADGRMPEADNEIACDYNTLSKLGYSAELGQEITFNYFNDNNSSSCYDPQRSATYILTGVLENFTDAWSVSQLIPGALLTEEGCNLLDSKVNMVYMYGLKDGIRLDDYQSIYDELSSYNSKKIYFNTNVYDFEPWGPKEIYNYIYLLVMVIGIAALTYQIISYQHSRKQHYALLYRLGATKGTVWRSRSFENALIIVPSGVLGILGTILTGRLIGWILESKKGVAFFHVNLETVLKGMVALVIAFLVGELVNLSMTFLSESGSVAVYSRNKQKQQRQQKQQKQQKQQRQQIEQDQCVRENRKNQCVQESGQEQTDEHTKQHKKNKQRLRQNNVTWQMHVRLSRSNGLAMRAGARIFSLGITIVILFCGTSIYRALKEYNAVSAKADITGFQEQDGMMQYYLNLPYDYSQSGIDGYTQGTIDYLMSIKTGMLSREEFISFKREETELSENGELTGNKDIEKGIYDIPITDRYCKLGNTSLVNGIDENLKETIENTAGVKEVSYSAFETARDWDWDGMSLKEMGVQKLSSSGNKLSGYSDTYLFATEYVDPTEELYERLSKYMDASQVDYEAFANGEQVLVFEEENVNQDYDDTIQQGTQLNFHYYRLPITISLAGLSSGLESDSAISEPLYPFWNSFIEFCTNKYYDKHTYEGPNFTYSYYTETDESYTDEFYGYYYKLMYEPCVSSNVAAVIQVTDEVKEDLADILSEYGYYTAIASSQLGKQACENQNAFMKEILGDAYTDGLDCEFTYNQVTATYDLSSSFSATDNVLCSYFKANNVSYQSSASVKEEYRTNALNAILQYGITMIATIVINILIYSILTRNRLELRKQKLQLLARLGAGKSQLRMICIIEVLRESLWCIFTAPLQILVQYLICHKGVDQL